MRHQPRVFFVCGYMMRQRQGCLLPPGKKQCEYEGNMALVLLRCANHRE